jgi:hypothetical protein
MKNLICYKIIKIIACIQNKIFMSYIHACTHTYIYDIKNDRLNSEFRIDNDKWYQNPKKINKNCRTWDIHEYINIILITSVKEIVANIGLVYDILTNNLKDLCLICTSQIFINNPNRRKHRKIWLKWYKKAKTSFIQLSVK